MDDTPTVEQALADLLALNDRCAVSLSGLMPTCDPTRCDQDPDHRPEKCLWCRARRAVASRLAQPDRTGPTQWAKARTMNGENRSGCRRFEMRRNHETRDW